MICYRHHRTRVSYDEVVLKLTLDKIGKKIGRIVDETRRSKQENLIGP